MANDLMTAAEAERRLDTLYYCGGTPEERIFALKRWKAALAREWYAERSQAKRELAEALR